MVSARFVHPPAQPPCARGCNIFYSFRARVRLFLSPSHSVFLILSFSPSRPHCPLLLFPERRTRALALYSVQRGIAERYNASRYRERPSATPSVQRERGQISTPSPHHPAGPPRDRPRERPAFVCVPSMGIDILFPIVRVPFFLHFFYLSPLAVPGFFSIIILFRIQSIISISIVLRYFHLASRSARRLYRCRAMWSGATPDRTHGRWCGIFIGDTACVCVHIFIYIDICV